MGPGFEWSKRICHNTIIIAPSTDTSIINMTLNNINSKHIAIKTSFINSTIIIHPSTNKIEIDSKMFANSNVVSLEAQKATTIRTNASDDNQHEDMNSNKQNQKIATMSISKKTQAGLKTDNFLFQLFGNAMVFVNNTIDVNPKSVLVNIDDKLRNTIIFENNTFYLKSDAIFNEVRQF